MPFPFRYLHVICLFSNSSLKRLSRNISKYCPSTLQLNKLATTNGDNILFFSRFVTVRGCDHRIVFFMIRSLVNGSAWVLFGMYFGLRQQFALLRLQKIIQMYMSATIYDFESNPLCSIYLIVKCLKNWKIHGKQRIWCKFSWHKNLIYTSK